MAALQEKKTNIYNENQTITLYYNLNGFEYNENVKAQQNPC